MSWAVITGASSGIGYALAREFAINGTDIVAVARNEKRLKKLKDDFEKKYKIKVITAVLDLADAASADALYGMTSDAGLRVDYLVNDAGFGLRGDFLDTDFKIQQDMLTVNVLSMMRLCHLYGNDMRNNGMGRILNLSSMSAFFAGPYMSVYYATKAFVLSFSQALREELRGTGVMVTALCPGPTDTEFEKRAKLNRSEMYKFVKPKSAEYVAETGYAEMMKGKSVVYCSAIVRASNVMTRLITRKQAAALAREINEIQR